MRTRKGAETNESTRLFVPKREAQAFHAFAQRDPTNVAQLGIIGQAFVKTIVGNAARQVVNMVAADIRREPAKRLGQVKIRTPAERSFVEVPVVVPAPIGVFELVLDIE